MRKIYRDCSAPVALLTHMHAFTGFVERVYTIVSSVQIGLIGRSVVETERKLVREKSVASHGNVCIFRVAGGAGSVETTTPVAFGRFRADVQLSASSGDSYAAYDLSRVGRHHAGTEQHEILAVSNPAGCLVLFVIVINFFDRKSRA